MNNLLFISRVQFGYNTDQLKWCEYLRDKYKITHISIGSKEKCVLPGVKQILINGRLPRVFRGATLMMISIIHIVFSRGIIIVGYFPHCELFPKLFPRRRMLLDIRTMSVADTPNVREIENLAIRRAASHFRIVTAISTGVAEQLAGTCQNIGIVPLGADLIPTLEKSFDALHFLYVGTLYNRDIDKTILGFALAREKLPKDVVLTYDIVGEGRNNEIESFSALIKQLDLDDVVHLHGFIQHSKLNSFYETCNVGVSYVPITPYYECQPVTKTFEYALAGLYVLATNTFENRQVITSENGILVQDSIESFADGVVSIYKIRKNIKSTTIQGTLLDYCWPTIVEEKLLPVIESM